MKTHNPDNERIKRAYFTYLIEAQGFSDPTIDSVAKAINRFETYTRFRDFKAFHIEQAKGFKASLAEQMSLRTKDRLSKATLYATLSALKRSIAAATLRREGLINRRFRQRPADLRFDARRIAYRRRLYQHRSWRDELAAKHFSSAAPQ
jgi:hypothetical protein